MGLLSDARDSFRLIRTVKKGNVRSFNEWVAMLTNSAYNHEPNFLDGNSLGYQGLPQSADKFIGVMDYRVSPKDLYEMANRDTYVGGLFEAMEEALFKREFYIDVVKDKNGKELGSKRRAIQYKDMLKKANFEELAIKQVYADRSDGGGNALIYTTQGAKGLEFNVEPFLYNGRPRVRVFGDIRTHKIIRYEVLDETLQTVYALDPAVNYMMHSRYSPSGDFRFSTGPAKKAVYWYVLKKYLAGANVAKFKHGLQDTVIMSPDYSALTALVGAMQTGQVSAAAEEEWMKNPIAFLARMATNDKEILASIAGKPELTNTLMKMSMPYKFTTAGADNNKLSTLPLLEHCNKEMGYIYRTSEGILSTSNSKYDNAEIERDNWSDLVLDPIKRKIERLAMYFFMPALDPNFDSSIYKVRFGRDPEQENIDIYEAKTARNTAKAALLVELSQIPDIAKYNFDTDEIEEVTGEEKTNAENAKEPDNDEDNDEVVEDKDLSRSLRVKKKTISERAIHSDDAKKFGVIIQRSVTKQLEDYVLRAKKYSDPQKLLANIEKDIQPIARFGLPVNTYKQQLLKFARYGINDFEEKSGKRVLIRVDDTFEYPKSILEMLDAKSQLMVKGYSSLSDEQKNLVRLFYQSDPARKSIRGYQGMDQQTTEQVNTIIRNKLASSTEDNVITVQDILMALDDLLPDLAKSRKIRIVNTEIAQTVQATRYNLYHEDGWNKKKWVDSGDDLVRPSHRENSREGYIDINGSFSSGAKSPSDEIECRCDLVFGKD